jgi:probable F420-dependent oxidoreductase
MAIMKATAVDLTSMRSIIHHRFLRKEPMQMRFGFNLPQFGPIAGPDALVVVARRAEEIGYDSLWVIERLLYPVQPQSPYPVTADGSLPVQYRRSLDPLAVLSYVAAHTSRVRIGTTIINLPFYNPVLLARHLSTIDLLSGGRLSVGFGLGWSPDEFEAVGVPMNDRGRRAEEALRLLQAIWTENPVEFQGRYFRLPKSYIDLKPVQKPRPPIYMAAYTPSALSRVARLADGWNPSGVPVGAMQQMFGAIKQMATEAGRDANTLKLIVTANIEIHAEELGPERLIFSGTPDQIEADIAATRQLGADELIFNAQFSPGLDSSNDLIALMERLWDMSQR